MDTPDAPHRTVEPHGPARDDRAAGDATWHGHVVVCGLGGLALRVVEQLHATGETVVVVRDPAGADPATVRTSRTLADRGVPVVAADATVPGALEPAGIARAAALIAVESSDLRTLQIALVVRERRPDVRIVTALANAAVGRAVADDPGPGTVLDVAALASPALVEACLESPVHELDVGGRPFLAASTTAPRVGTLRSLYGDLAPLAVSGDADDPATHVCPGRDHLVGPGDRVSLLGTPEELEEAGLPTAAATIAPRPSVRTRRGGGYDPDAARGGAGRAARARSVVLQVARDSDRGLRWALVAFLALLVVSTVVLKLGYRTPPQEMSVVDALYFTVESVATVGFGDYSFAEQALWLRLWAVFLMLAGVVATAIPLAFFTDILISRRLASTAGRRRAAQATGHVVLVGLGAVGVAVLEALRARGRDVVVVESSESNRFLDRARELGAPVVFGDATDPATLRAARVPHAVAVAVVTSDDMANLECGLAVRDVLGAGWSTTAVVMRLFDRELAGTVARRFGFRSVHSTADLAAPWFVGAALGLHVLGTFPALGQAFLLGRLSVAPGDGLDGVAMAELSARTRVVALRREGITALEHPPRRDTRFSPGDEAYLVGPYEELLEVLGRRRSPAAASTQTSTQTSAHPSMPGSGSARLS